ncbi:oxidoreductase [Streptosporangium nondiastaticum]|uniref:Carboxylic acid reductase n=1 Tax=Streptosporangium nondiastaticum TaxID=35764 RepID=A0A9X7JMG6_9ACTN|nr:thioester reductase domain-containing protein [Streptosporangium nondiastaticum]PSJ26385.1 oxidoreductase [Streptosporangium nondiastaticum]
MHEHEATHRAAQQTEHPTEPPTDHRTETEHAASRAIASRIEALHTHDPEFARAAPSPSVVDAVRRADGSLIGTISAAMSGYADRPALGRRAERIVEDPDTGRRTTELLPHFETVTYAELWREAGSLAAAWADPASGGLNAGDFIGVLGFTSTDYATIDLACMYLGAVSVPLPTGWSAARLAPILTETEPRILATDLGSVDAAVDAVLATESIERLVVFDYDPRVDDHREALQTAVGKLDGRAPVVPLQEELSRGRRLPALEPRDDGDPDRLVGLIYTSGSTGAPKGAMYTASMITRMWQNSRTGTPNAAPGSDRPVPTIVLHYMPMSHVNGRARLISGLASGGTGFFTARSDMSTLFDDIGLARPTVLSLVPRICDMVHQQYLLEADRLSRTGTPRPARAEAEAAALTRVRDDMLGGRIVSALCGSAPLSSQMHTFMAEVLGTKVIDCYGSTETTRPVVVDQQVRRPPVIDYRLVDVPELGYFATDKPHPRGELRLKSVGLVQGYYKQPEVTARAFDEDGYYKTGDVVAEIAPDRLVYVDRINNVVKLSQGEFVAVSRLEALYSTSPYISQIYVYGSSEQAFLLAVVVADREQLALEQVDDDAAIRAKILDSMRELARDAGLNPYEVPYDVILEPQPFTIENGLLSGVGKLLRPSLKDRYGARLEQLYADIAGGRAGRIAALRAAGRAAEPLEAVLAAVQITLGYPASMVVPQAAFTDLGGDSLSALTFSTVLEQIFDTEVPVQAVLSPTSTLAGIAEHLAAAPATASVPRPTFASVHGRGATEVKAGDLTLDRFVDEEVLARAPKTPDWTDPSVNWADPSVGRTDLPGERTDPSADGTSPTATGNVLLTGATGYLGRFLAVEWLERVAASGGRLTVLARGADDAAAGHRVLACLRGASGDRTDWFDAVAAQHLEVLAADVSAPQLGLDRTTWERLAAETDRIVHSAALVNHVLPYSRLFEPNVAATARLIELALTHRMKRFAYVSTIAAAMMPDGTFLDETADVRTASPVRQLNDSDANGYATSKWAGEVLLRDAHDRTGLPVVVFRPDMILAHSRLTGQLNLPDRFTRLLLSVVATGMAPRSFHRLDADGNRRRAHYSGLPVDFTADAIASLSARSRDGYVTYNSVNANDDDVSLDEIVDWLIRAGHPITRIDDYEQWRVRFEAALRGLPEHQRRLSMLPLMRAYARPTEPRTSSMVPARRFTAAVAESGAGGGAIPSLSADFIDKYVADLRALGVL